MKMPYPNTPTPYLRGRYRENYNRELVNEYDFQVDDNETIPPFTIIISGEREGKKNGRTTFSKSASQSSTSIDSKMNVKMKSKQLLCSLICLRAFLTRFLLPQGFPHSVSVDYLKYTLWHVAAGFFEDATHAITNYAFLKGLGFSNSNATLLGAVYTETIIKIVNLLVVNVFVASIKGTKFDSESKWWLCIARIVLPIADNMLLLGTAFPPQYFAVFGSVRTVLRSVIHVTTVSSATSIHMHQAMRNNLADISAKGLCQRYAVELISIPANFLLLKAIDQRPLVMWVCNVNCQITAFVFTYRALRSLRLDMLNGTRLRLCVRRFIESGEVPALLECNQLEPLVFRCAPPVRRFGCALRKLPNLLTPAHKANKKDEKSSLVFKTTPFYVCVYDTKRKCGWVSMSETAGEIDEFRSACELEFYAIGGRWPTKEETEKFMEKLVEKEWRLSPQHLGFDEWRYCEVTSDEEGEDKSENSMKI